MASDLHHFSVMVADLNRTIYLFRDILGFKLRWRLPKVSGKKFSQLFAIPDLEMELAYLQDQSNKIGLELSRLIRPVKEIKSIPVGSPGTMGLSLMVEDLEGLHRRLTEEGWVPFSPPIEMVSPEGDPLRLFCFQTEEGLTLELIEPV